MKKLRKISKEYYLRQIVCCWLVFYMLFCFGMPVRIASAGPDYRLPRGWELVTGSADVPDYDTGTMYIRNIVNGTIFKWNAVNGGGGFNIGSDALAAFEFINAGSSVMNRDVTGNMSEIYGTLTANGRVFIINPAGIVFGGGATINVSQLVASGLGMTDDAFETVANNVNAKMVFSGSSGNVTINSGTLDATGTDSLYFVGRSVFNNGAILCPDGLVVMAAGSTVQLGQPGSDVIVELADLTADSGNVVNNNGTVGETGDGRVEKLVLAAGDVWSQAISDVKKVEIAVTGSIEADDLDNIYAYNDEADSDIVADVTIISGGDLTIDENIIAEAVGNDVDNAVATVTIKSLDGSVEVKETGSGDTTQVVAIAFSGVNSSATVDISAAEDVKVTAENGGYASVRAEARYADNINTAKVKIDAGDDVKVKADGWGSGPLSRAEVKAIASNDDEENNANIEITAGDNVDVMALSGGQATIAAEASYGTNNTADVKITAEDGRVLVHGIDEHDDDPGYALIAAVAKYAESKNSADVTITAKDLVDEEEDGDGDVGVIAVKGGKAEIEAIAMYGDDNSATVDITADGDVEVKADGYGSGPASEAEIMALAKDALNTNTADITINAGEDVKVFGIESGNAQIEAIAKYAADSENSATITITTEDGYVLVHGIDENDDDPGHASIEAWAEGAYGEDSKNSADVTITANNDDCDDCDDKEGDVRVIAVDGGEAEVRAEARYGDENTANIKIDADGDVKVIAKGYGSGPASEAEIYAEATNDDEKNTADITINAGGNVWVMSEESGIASILAEASYGFENIANVTITTEDNGYVLVHGIGGAWRYGDFESSRASIEAVAEYARSENTADVTITTNADDCEDCDKKGDVRVIAVDGGNAGIEALAMNSFENTADVTINSAGDVKVIAKGYGSGPDSVAAINAIAKNDLNHQLLGDWLSPEAGVLDNTVGGLENDASVNITALNVEVTGEDRGRAQIGAHARNEWEVPNLDAEILNLTVGTIENTADVTITALGDIGADYDTGDVKVTAEEGGKARIEAKANNRIIDDSKLTVNLTVDGPVENTAKVLINADDDVEVTADGYGSGPPSEARIQATAENLIRDVATVITTVDGPVENTADVDITTGYDVKVEAEDGAIAKIKAIAENKIDETVLGPLENKANVKIDAGTNVKVIANGSGSGPPSIAEIEAIAEVATENTADVTIDADCDVEVSGGVDDHMGIAGINARAQYALNENNADITINADNVKVTAGNAEQGYKGTAQIVAEAKWGGFHGEASDGSGNSADVTITADGDVLVHARAGDETAKIRAEAEYGYDNTANIDITATTGNVEVIGGSAEDNHGGKAEIVAKANVALNDNTADITINADGDVLVHGIRGEDNAKIRAEAGYADNSNTANIGIDAGGNVEVIAGSDEYQLHGTAKIEAEAEDGTENTADIEINAGGDVKVIDFYGDTAKIQALAHNWIDVYGDQTVVEGLENTANIDITATNVEVRAEDDGHAYIEADAHNTIYISNYSPIDLTIEDFENTAGVTITTTGVDAGIDAADGDGDVLVIGEDSGEADIDAEAFNEIYPSYYGYGVDLTVQGPIENKADVVIDATGDVAVHALEGGQADIDAEAQNMLTGYSYTLYIVEEQGPIENTATVDITAGDTVEVRAIGFGSGPPSEAKINAEAWNYNDNDYAEYGGQVQRWPLPDEFPDVKDNTATVLIDAGGDVEVEAVDGGHAEIEAIARYGVNNSATVDIDAVGDVRVKDIGLGMPGMPGGIIATAKIEAIAMDAIMSNTANVLIGAIDDRVGGNVEVTAGEVGNPGSGGFAYIEAIATNAYGDFDDDNGDEGENTANVAIFNDGDVEVTAVEGGYASIAAKTWDATTNNSDVLICADSVLVQAGAEMVEFPFGYAEIKAEAIDGENNNAYVAIGARGDVEVLNYNASHSSIAARAYNPEWMDPALSNNADVVICADGSVLVIDQGGGIDQVYTAEIVAEALYGISNTADVGICADCDSDGDGDVVVAADDDGAAWIKAIAGAWPGGPGPGPGPMITAQNNNLEPTSADAKVVVVSHAGSVLVGSLGGYASIKAEAMGAYTTADVGIAAGKELAPADVPELEEPDVLPEDIDDILDLLPPGNVVVYGGDLGFVEIGAYALGGVENTADIVICAPGTVAVISESDGGLALITAIAAGMGSLDSATIQVYASDGIVSDGAYVQAITPGAGGLVEVTDWSPGEDVPASQNGATLILDDYGARGDNCPDCLPCPLCDLAEAWLAPVAPLAQFQIPTIEGCPVEMAAAASELGITAETIQVGIGNALALNPTIQPCQACAALVDAASVLRDEDGSRMAAMVQAFNALAPATVPFTPEMATSIAMAFEGAAEGSQYASAMEYVDAFVQYVAVLDIELGSPVGEGDSVAFVMGKYGAGITGSDNANIASFVATRLEAISR